MDGPSGELGWGGPWRPSSSGAHLCGEVTDLLRDPLQAVLGRDIVSAHWGV